METVDILYVPWRSRRLFWEHDHNDLKDRDWSQSKTAVVGKLKRVRQGLFQAACKCGTLFVADADRHMVYPPVAALGLR